MLHRKAQPNLSEKALIALSATAAVVPLAGLFGGLYLLVRQFANAL